MRHALTFAWRASLVAAVVIIGAVLRRGIPAQAQTSSGPPAQLSCNAGSAALGAGSRITCTIIINLQPQQGEPLTLSPIGGTVTSCVATDPRFVATGPGGLLPTYTPAQFANVPLAQAAIGQSTNVPGNTCAYTQIPPGLVVGGTPVGTITFTTANPVACGAEIGRMNVISFEGNGQIGFTPAGLPITFSEAGFTGNVSEGFLVCAGQTAAGSVVSTGLPAQANCNTPVASSAVPGSSSFSCTVTNNFFLATGSTLLVSANNVPLNCTSNTPGIIAVSAGQQLPVVVLVPTFGGPPQPTQASINGSVVVPPNNCGFFVTAPTPPAIQSGTVVGSISGVIPTTQICTGFVTFTFAAFVPNETGIIFAGSFVTFPETAQGQSSAGFLLCGGLNTGAITNTQVPAQKSCDYTISFPLISCSVQANVELFTGDTMIVTPSTRGVNVRFCSPAPGTIATGPNQALPVINQNAGSIVTGGPLQTAINNGRTVTVPANSCGFTFAGSTPPGLQAGMPAGIELVDVDPTSTTACGSELIQNVQVFRADSVQFGVGLIGSAPNQIANNTFNGTMSGGTIICRGRAAEPADPAVASEPSVPDSPMVARDASVAWLGRLNSDPIYR